MVYIYTQVKPKVCAKLSCEAAYLNVCMAGLCKGFASPGETCLS